MVDDVMIYCRAGTLLSQKEIKQIWALADRCDKEDYDDSQDMCDPAVFGDVQFEKPENPLPVLGGGKAKAGDKR